MNYLISFLIIFISFNEFNHLDNSGNDGDFKILTDSTCKYDFGYTCYKNGMPPQGRKAIGRLIENNKTDLIIKVLDGENNEGKIYAIEALLQLNLDKKISLSEIIKIKIKFIINQNFILNRCQGCSKSTISSTELFSEKVYKKLLNKNGIEL